MLFGATPRCGEPCLTSKKPTPSIVAVPRSVSNVLVPGVPHARTNALRAATIFARFFAPVLWRQPLFGISTIIVFERALSWAITRWMSPSLSTFAETSWARTRYRERPDPSHGPLGRLGFRRRCPRKGASLQRPTRRRHKATRT
jgi:hypothetical protein